LDIAYRQMCRPETMRWAWSFFTASIITRRSSTLKRRKN